MAFVRHIFNKESPDQIQISDIKKLIENKTEEFLHLDYEEIPRTNVKYDGLAEHVSGFLNTSGWDSQSSLRHVHCPRCGKIITHSP